MLVQLCSTHNLINDAAMNVGQTHVASAKAKRLSGLIDALQVQYGGLQIMDFNPALDRFVAILVGCS